MGSTERFEPFLKTAKDAIAGRRNDVRKSRDAQAGSIANRILL
jgi:hypothetical protein